MNNYKNILVIGDIHCKEDTILPKIDKFISKYQVDKIIFLGDYVDEWGMSDEEKIDHLKNLIKWKNKLTTPTIFLCGNHDLAYIDPTFLCSGHSSFIEDEVRDLLINELDIEFSDYIDNYLLTHAGVNNLWWFSSIMKFEEKNYANYSAQEFHEVLNPEWKKYKNLLKKQSLTKVKQNPENDKWIYYFAMCGPFRGGMCRCSGPVWCDRLELLQDPIYNINQIVGHTPVETITQHNLTSPDDPNEKTTIIMCDTHSLYRDYRNIGDSSCLYVTNKKLKKADIINLTISDIKEVL